MNNATHRTRTYPLTLFLVLVISACSFSQDKATAERAVDLFHQQLQASKIKEIYAASDPDLKKSVDEAGFAKVIAKVTEVMGAYQSSSQASWHVNAMTNGTFVTLRYESQFTKGKGTEEFRWKLSGPSTTLVGYKVDSPLFLKLKGE